MAAKVLVIFDGKEGSTIDRMASGVANGIREAGVEAICETVENARPEDFLAYAGIILGSPCHFAGPSARIKALLDRTWSLRGKLQGKVGAAFTFSAHIGGGGETALRTLHDFFLIHGMVIQGDIEGDFFGPVAINPTGEPGEAFVEASGDCQRLGQRVAELVKKLAR